MLLMFSWFGFRKTNNPLKELENRSLKTRLKECRKRRFETTAEECKMRSFKTTTKECETSYLLNLITKQNPNVEVNIVT
jgi:hypothetical protein